MDQETKMKIETETHEISEETYLGIGKRVIEAVYADEMAVILAPVGGGDLPTNTVYHVGGCTVKFMMYKDKYTISVTGAQEYRKRAWDIMTNGVEDSYNRGVSEQN